MSKEKSILKSTVIVTVVTFAIKFLGLVKQSVVAAYCGATDETDAFFIASGVVFALSTMIFSGISISLLSLHTNKLMNQGREQANQLINVTLVYFLPISVFITIIFIIAAPWIAKFLAPSYGGELLQLLVYYIRLMSSVFVLCCYYLTINVILETDKEFVPGRMYGFFQNVFLILAAVLLFSSMGMEALIWAFIVSGVAECILVTICAGKRFRIIWKRINIGNKDIKNLFQLSLPLIFGNALYELNDIVDKQISSGLGTGNASYLTYGSTVNEIVTGVVIASISIVLFSHFTSWVAQTDTKKVEDGLNKSTRYLTFIIFPIMAMCLLSGENILRLFYGRGSFGDHEITMTQMVVIGYALGFVFSSIRANMVKVFYAFQDTKRPLVNGVISVIVNIICSITLSQYLGVGGIATATSISMLLSVILLCKQIKQHLPNYSVFHPISEYFKGFLAFMISCVSLYASHYLIVDNFYLRLFFDTILCIITYITVLVACRSTTIKQLYQLIPIFK